MVRRMETDTEDIKLPTDLVLLPQLLEARPFLSERWVRGMVAGRKIPFFKLGGKLLFSLREVDQAVTKSHQGT